MKKILFLHGFYASGQLKEAGADFIIDSMKELIEIVGKIWQ